LSFYELDCEQEQSAYKIDHDKFLFWFLCKKRENRERERGEIKEMGVVFVKVN
jgi:predicted N-acyltransferase